MICGPILMRFVIDRFEDDEAVLRTDDGQDLVVPITELPEGAAEGGVVDANFGVAQIATNDRSSRAKDILNEILGSNDQ